MALEVYTPPTTAVIHETTVDIGNIRQLPKIIKLTQGDKSLPVIAIKLLNSGEPYKVPESATDAMLNFLKGDGKAVINSALGVSDDRRTVYVETTEQTCAVSGRGRAILQVMIGEHVAGTSFFFIEVEPNPTTDASLSETEIGALQGLVDDANAAKTDAQKSASNASKSASDAEVSADEAADSATLAEQHKNDAETAKNSAEQFANTAEQEATDAENAKNSASSSANMATEKAREAVTNAASAISSAGQALQYKNSASTSATNASTSANKASDSANTARQHADRAKTEADRANAVANNLSVYNIDKMFKTKTYVELCRSKYSYTDGSSLGAITIDGVLGGWLGNQIGYTNIFIPLRTGANPTVTHAGRTISYGNCDLIAVHDGAGNTHVYLEMSGYATCSLSMKGTPRQWEETDHTPFTTTPHGDEFFRLSMVEEGIFDRVYPVGSIYISTSSTNPRSYFGVGTWEEIQGKFLLGHSFSHPAGSTGGEERHTLSTSEMPAHGHVSAPWSISTTTNFKDVNDPLAFKAIGSGNMLPRIQSTRLSNNGQVDPGHVSERTGDGQAINNMPPFLTVYIWKRIA